MNSSGSPAPIGVKLEWARRVVDAAAKHGDCLTTYEEQFARNLAANLNRHGAEAHLAPGELTIARRIGRKLEVGL